MWRGPELNWALDFSGPKSDWALKLGLSVKINWAQAQFLFIFFFLSFYSLHPRVSFWHPRSDLTFPFLLFFCSFSFFLFFFSHDFFLTSFFSLQFCFFFGLLLRSISFFLFISLDFLSVISFVFLFFFFSLCSRPGDLGGLVRRRCWERSRRRLGGLGVADEATTNWGQRRGGRGAG